MGEDSLHQNAASGDNWIITPSEKLDSSGVLMSGFFEGLSLILFPISNDFLTFTLDFEYGVNERSDPDGDRVFPQTVVYRKYEKQYNYE